MKARAKSRRTGAREPVRYAVVGLGHIAQVAMLPAFAHARRNSVLAGFVSGDLKKIAAMRRRYGPKPAWGYDEYDEMLESGEIDAVYVALPNDMHHRFALRALEAGVHVLCEKPLAPTAAECRELVRAAEANDAKLMTAYRLHFERTSLEVLERVRAGKIGPPRLFSSVFTMQVRDKKNIRLDSRRAGGPLNDIGIYCLNAARAVFRDEPEQVACFTVASADPRFKTVEESAAVVLRFPGDRLASFTCSFGAADVSQYRIVGTKGDVEVDPAYEYAEGLAYAMTVEGRKTRKKYAARDQFAPELLAFSDWIAGGRAPSAGGEEGLADARVLEALHRSASRGGVPVRLDGEGEPARRPALAQAVDKPKVSKPKLVRARSASGS